MKNFPNAFVILLGVILCSWLFTYIVPQGSYERYLDEETGITRVINDSYHSVDAERPNFFDLLVSIPEGLEKGGRSDCLDFFDRRLLLHH